MGAPTAAYLPTRLRLSLLEGAPSGLPSPANLAARSLRRLHYHQQRPHMFGIESWPHH